MEGSLKVIFSFEAIYSSIDTLECFLISEIKKHDEPRNESRFHLPLDFKKKNINLNLIDNYGIDGDFVESQAFAYLAIRSCLNLPISFPETTGANKPCTGGVIVKN